MSKRFLLILAVAIILGVPFLGLVQRNRLNVYKGGVMMNTVAGEPMMDLAQPSLSQGVAQDAALYREEMGKVTGVMPSQITPPMPYGEGFTPTIDRTIIRNAFMTLLVKDTRVTVSQVTQLMTQESGFVTSSNIYEDGPSQSVLTANMTLRVPAARLDGVLEKLRDMAERVTSETTSSVDATEQKIDLDAQLANLKTTEAQLQRLMSQSQNVTQTLEVQRELTSVRGQIERLTAQVENLQGDADMATISLSISTQAADLPYVGGGEASIWEEIKVAVRDAVRLYRELFVAGVRLAIIGLPLILVAGVGYALWTRFRQPKV